MQLTTEDDFNDFMYKMYDMLPNPPKQVILTDFEYNSLFNKKFGGELYFCSTHIMKESEYKALKRLEESKIAELEKRLKLLEESINGTSK